MGCTFNVHSEMSGSVNAMTPERLLQRPGRVQGPDEVTKKHEVTFMGDNLDHAVRVRKREQRVSRHYKVHTC